VAAARAPTFASDWDVLFSAVVRQRLFVTLHRAVAASLAAENASRLAAMHAAQRNIEERLDALHGQFHLQRQTSITTELLDIVSGYEALTGR
jgi:F-type H+-transporting ATPase subunit gamma